MSPFTLLDERPLPYLQAHARLLRHDTCQSELLQLHIPTAREHTLVACLPSPPDDHFGSSHALEHCIFQGSARYPHTNLHSLLRRSGPLSHLQAQTGPDHSLYTLASPDREALDRATDLLLDMLLHPILAPRTLQSEVLHPDHATAAIHRELLAEQQDPSRMMAQAFRAALFAETPYTLPPGGDLSGIARLDRDRLLDYHQRHYQPNQLRLLHISPDTITDDPSQPTLASLAAALEGLPPGTVARPWPDTPKWSSPRADEIILPRLGTGPQERHWIGWRMAPCTRATEQFLQATLSCALLGLPDAPLREHLREGGYGRLRQSVHIDSLREGFACALIDELEEHQIDNSLRSLMLRLEQLRTTGLPASLLERAWIRQELSLRQLEALQGRRPSMVLAERLMVAWRHGADPLDALDLDQLLRSARQRLRADPDLFDRMLSELFLENAQRLALHGRSAPIEENRTSTQSSPNPTQATASSPALSEGPTPALDRPPRPMSTLLSVEQEPSSRMLRYALPQQGLFTLQIELDLAPVLDAVQIPQIPLLAHALLAEMPHDRAICRAKLLAGQPPGSDRPAARLCLIACGLREQAGPILDAWLDRLELAGPLEHHRLRAIEASELRRMQAQLQHRPMALLQGRAAASLQSSAWLDNHWSGLGYLRALRARQRDPRRDRLGALRDMRAQLLDAGAHRKARLCLEPEPDSPNTALQPWRRLEDWLEDSPPQPSLASAPDPIATQALWIGAPTQLCRALKASPRQLPAMAALCAHLNLHTLGTAQRGQGPLAQASASVDPIAGIASIQMGEVLDLQQTLDWLDALPEQLAGELDADVDRTGLLRQAITSFSPLPSAPALLSQAARLELAGISDGEWRARQEQLLSLESEDLLEALRGWSDQTSADVVLGNAAQEELLERHHDEVIEVG